MVEVRRGTLVVDGRGEDEEKEEEEDEEATNIKSNNLHLAGGEITFFVDCRVSKIHSLLQHPS